MRACACGAISRWSSPIRGMARRNRTWSWSARSGSSRWAATSCRSGTRAARTRRTSPSTPGECYNVAVSQQLNDKDVDRIASRVVQKLVMYGLVIVAGIWIVPLVVIAAVTSIGYATRDLPFVLGVAIAATAIALPLVALIWIWGRRER